MADAPPPPSILQQIKNANYMVVVGLVLISWELLVHLFQDISYLRTKGWYKRPVVWSYFLQRYGAFVVLVCQANIELGHPSSCYAAGLISLIVGGVIVLPSISLIYLYRVLAIWNHRAFVKWTLIVMWVLLLGASITAPFSQEAANLPDGTCVIARTEKYTPVSFIANTAYDTLVFALTIVKLAANRQQYKNFTSPIQTLLLRDGVLYFAVSIAVGITNTVFLEAVTVPIVASTIIPFHIAIASVMTTRLVNNVFRLNSGGSGMIQFVGTGQTGNSSFGAGVSRSTGRSGQWMMIGSGVGTNHYREAPKSAIDFGGSPMQVQVTQDKFEGSHF